MSQLEFDGFDTPRGRAYIEDDEALSRTLSTGIDKILVSAGIYHPGFNHLEGNVGLSDDVKQKLIAGMRSLASQWFVRGVHDAGHIAQGSPDAARPANWGSAQAFLPGGNPALLVVQGDAETMVFDADDPDGNGMGLSSYIEANRGKGEQ